MQISTVNKHVFGWFINQNLDKYKKPQIPTKIGGVAMCVWFFLISESKKQIENPISFSAFFKREKQREKESGGAKGLKYPISGSLNIWI